MGFISAVALESLANKLPNDYGSYLKRILQESDGPGIDGTPS
jgi:hypothetical protein